MKKTFIVIVCGPTASGKTRLAAALARDMNGEVISADSMQIYQGMDIATAKPTEEEMLGVPHHLIGFLPPTEPFSVADWLIMAKEKIADISARGKLPVICGGTGLYISSLADNIIFDDTGTDMSYREELRGIAMRDGNGELLRMLSLIDPETAETLHENNQSRIIRALEYYRVSGKKLSDMKIESRSQPSPYEVCMLMPDYTNREELYARIDRRVDLMVEAGLINEARNFFKHSEYPTANQAIGYKELKPYIEGREELSVCTDRLKAETRHYAKRQLTWFRRDKRIESVPAGSGRDFDEILAFAKNCVKRYSF